MTTQLPRPRSVLIVLVAFSAVVLGGTHLWSGEAPTAPETRAARRVLLASPLSEYEAPSSCQAQRALFLKMRAAAPTPKPLDVMHCELEMVQILGDVLREARADLEAGRPDCAFSKARAVVAHNQAALGHRSLVGLSVASTRATEAIALMQVIAARSMDSALRMHWRQQSRGLLAGRMAGDQLAMAVVAGEGRAYLLEGDGAFPNEMSEPAVDRLLVAYAGLQNDLEHGEAFVPACFERTGELPGCTRMAEVEREQRVLVSDIELLLQMLKPRT